MRRTPLARTTVRDALDSALIALTAAGVDTPRLDAELLLADALGATRADIVAGPGAELEPAQARRFQEHVRRRVQREPVAYILGTKGFRTIELEVDPRVLIPRPETEHLVEAALDLPAGARVADVGTGSGAVALALKAERPDLDIVGTDSSEAALDVARANARALGLDVELLHGDLLEPVSGPVDAVLSNPPYVADGDALAPEITRYEPADGAVRRPRRAGRDPPARPRRGGPGRDDGGVRGRREARPTRWPRSCARRGSANTTTACDLAGIERVVVGRR